MAAGGRDLKGVRGSTRECPRTSFISVSQRTSAGIDLPVGDVSR